MCEPRPRETVLPFRRHAWSFGKSIRLSRPGNLTFATLDKIIESRHTRRQFGKISDDCLGNLLWYASRTITSEVDSNDCEVQHRPAPSAGALHPIHVIIHNAENQCLKYIPEQHALGLCTKDFIDSAHLRREADFVVQGAQGLLLQLVAEPAITEAKYSNADSLLYRDAGVLLGYLSIVAEAMNLNFCPLGLTGNDAVENSDGQGQLRGVGLAWLGSRPA